MFVIYPRKSLVSIALLTNAPKLILDWNKKMYSACTGKYWNTTENEKRNPESFSIWDHLYDASNASTNASSAEEMSSNTGTV